MTSSQDLDLARARLRSVRTWGCQYQNIDLEALRKSPLDLIVIEPAHPAIPGRDLDPDQIARLKEKPGGGRRLVFAYLSVGEAAEYRPYWKADWAKAPPPWLGPANPSWPMAHTVRYWLDGWQDVLFKNEDSMLARILAAGFDGAFLDRVDAYGDWRGSNPRAKDDMIGLIAKLSSEARKLHPNFLLIGQNSEELLRQAAYRQFIDAVSKESLLYGLHGENTKNTDEDVAWSLGGLSPARADGLPIFMIEYVTEPALADDVKRRARDLGFTPFFGNRLLDRLPLSSW